MGTHHKSAKMGAVLAKIKGIVSKGNEAKDAKETVEDTECENPFCYSVAGPLHQQALFYIVVLVCVILFFVSLVPAAAGWKENIVTSDPTVVDEIEYPDMYLCHSPKLKHELTNGYGGAYVHTKYSSTDVSGANLQFGSTAKTTLDTGYSATVNTCPIMSVDDSYVKSLGCAGSMTFQADTPSGTNAAEQTDINLLRDARARVLNGYAYDKGDCSVTTPPAACTVTDSEASPTKPDCSLLRFNTFSKAERKGAPKYAVYLGELLKNDGNTPAAGLNVAYSSTTAVGNTDGTNGKTCSDPLEVYYTKRGESPVQNGEITASVALIPLCNNLFIGTISLRQVKDETAGDTDFKDEYIQSNYIVNTPACP